MLLDKVVFDTPAMLNMIKHCQSKNQGRIQTDIISVRGNIEGVLKQEPGENEKVNLFVNQTTPDTSNAPTKSLKAIIE